MASHPSTLLADALFGKTKKAVIGVLFARPEKAWHVRELARQIGVSPTMLSKEARVLSEAGILIDTRDGNRRSLAANPLCPIFEELRGIALKAACVPAWVAHPSRGRSHQDLDRRSLEMHRLVATKIRDNPALFERARAILQDWRRRASPNTTPYYDEWQRLMDRGIERSLAVATADSERATALRQTSPFSCLLTEAERTAFLKAWAEGAFGRA